MNILKIFMFKTHKLKFDLILRVASLVFLVMYLSDNYLINLFIFLTLSIPAFFNIKKVIIHIIIIGVILLSFYLQQSNDVSGYLSRDVEVHKKVSSGVIINEENANIFIKTNLGIEKGDHINVSGYISSPSNNYHNSLNIGGVIEKPNISYLSKQEGLGTKINKYFKDGPFYYKTYMPMFLLGKRNIFNYQFYKLMASMNLAHLVVISGFHLYIIYGTLSLMLFKLKAIYKSSIIILVMFAYVSLLGFPISASRALLIIIMSDLKKIFKKVKLSSFEMIAIALLIIISIDPFASYSFSLYFSFAASIIIIFWRNWEIKKYIKNLLLPLMIYGLLLPISLRINNTINVSAPLFAFIVTGQFSIFFMSIIMLCYWKSFVDTLIKLFITSIKQLDLISIRYEIPSYINNNLSFSYFIFAICFIIYHIWFITMEKKNI